MPFTHVALALLIVFIWGFNYVEIELGLHGLPPLLLCCARLFLTSIPAIFFVRLPRTSFSRILQYGLVLFGLQFSFLFLSMYAGISAGLASLLLQTHVVFSATLGCLFLGERLQFWQIVGAAISFIGIAIVGLHIDGNVTISGLLFALAAGAAWGIGNLISKKIGDVNMSSLVAWGSFVTWPPLLLASFLLEGPAQIITSLKEISLLSIGSVLYLSYLATFFAFGAWSWLLHQHRISTIAPFTLLTPVIAIAASVLVLGEPLQSWKVLAALFVIAGLCINVLGPYLKVFRK